MKDLLIITQKVDVNDQLLGFFIDWIDRFSKKFDKVTIFCLEKGEFILPENVNVISLGKDRNLSKLAQLFNFYKDIFQYRNQYDAVFVHMNPIWVVLGGFWWKIIKKKIFFWYTSGGVTAKLKFAEKLADTIFTASSESFRLSSKKVIVTGHGVNTELFKPSPNSSQTMGGKLKILSVGRISPVKNYEVLVDAAKILKKKGVDFSVAMVGEAPLEKDKNYELKIKNKVKELNLENNFSFLGKVNHRELVPYYQSHDIFIHLSKTGSVDKVLLEAMACGMKVLSSSDSARSFLPGEFIFKENDPVELAQKVEVIKERPVDPMLRNYVVENHNLDKLISKMSSIINL